MMQLVTLVLVVLYAVRWGEIVSTLSSGIIKIPYGPWYCKKKIIMDR